VQTAPSDTREEIDLAGYASRLAARWWIVALAVAVAVGISILQAQGGTKRTWDGRTLVYQGQPVTPTGQPATNAPASQPLFAQQIARAPATLEAAAAAAGLKPGQLNGHVSIQGASGTVGTRSAPAPYVNVVVRGPWGPKQVAAASQTVADTIVKEAGRYQAEKKTRLDETAQALQQRIDQIKQDRENLRTQIDNLDSAPGSDELKLIKGQLALSTIQAGQTLEFQLSQQLLDAQSQLASVDYNEAPRIIQPARGSRVDVSSKQANLVVAVILGLVAGVILALLSYVVWPPGGRRRGGDAATGTATVEN
jgi:hypothetical protein